MENCKEIVPDIYIMRRCSRKAKRDGYCTQHHPEAKAKRKREQEARWRAEYDARRAEYKAKKLAKRKAEAFDALLEAVEELNRHLNITVEDARIDYVEVQIDSAELTRFRSAIDSAKKAVEGA